MRTLAVVTGLLFVAGCQTAPPAGLTDADRAAINQLVADYQAAALASDAAAMAALWTEDAVYQIPEAPPISGREAIVESFQAFPAPTEMDVSISTPDGSGNWAWARGSWRYVVAATEEMPGMSMEGSFLWVLAKQADGSWLIDTECYNLDHPSEVPATDPAQIAAEVDAATDLWWDTWSAAEDADLFFSFMADDPEAHWIGDAVPHFDRASMEAVYRPVMENMQRQENAPVEWRTFVIAPGVAYTVRINDVSQIDLAGNAGPAHRYAETLLWVNRNGEWKVFAGHGSSAVE